MLNKTDLVNVQASGAGIALTKLLDDMILMTFIKQSIV